MSSEGGTGRKVMDAMTYDQWCDEIVGQTRQLAAFLEGRGELADVGVALPCCPGWNVGQLLRHLGGVQRWAADVVRARAEDPVPDDFHGPLTEYADEDLAVVLPWLVDSAEVLAGTLRAAGRGVALWTPVPAGTTDFYARRFTHETVMHRADVMLALGGEFTAERMVAVDALDEWIELGALPMHLDRDPRFRELLGAGRTIRLHATDLAGRDADWLVDLTGAVIAWRRSDEPAAVTVAAPIVALLLVVYGRLTVSAAGATVAGDEAMLDFWLERVGFG